MVRSTSFGAGCRVPGVGGLKPAVGRGGAGGLRPCRGLSGNGLTDASLAGEEPDPGGSRIPGVDNRRACDEIVQGPVLPLAKDPGEPEAAEQEAEWQRERAYHGPPRVEVGAVGPDHLYPEPGPAEGLAAHRPGVCEIQEFPAGVHDRDKRSEEHTPEL